jgi:hypothetical protein
MITPLTAFFWQTSEISTGTLPESMFFLAKFAMGVKSAWEISEVFLFRPCRTTPEFQSIIIPSDAIGAIGV